MHTANILQILAVSIFKAKWQCNEQVGCGPVLLLLAGNSGQSLHLEDGESKDLQNIRNTYYLYMMPLLRNRIHIKTELPAKPKIFYTMQISMQHTSLLMVLSMHNHSDLNIRFECTLCEVICKKEIVSVAHQQPCQLIGTLCTCIHYITCLAIMFIIK